MLRAPFPGRASSPSARRVAELDQGDRIVVISQGQVAFLFGYRAQIHETQYRKRFAAVPAWFAETEHLTHACRIDDHGEAILTVPAKVSADHERVGHFSAPAGGDRIDLTLLIECTAAARTGAGFLFECLVDTHPRYRWVNRRYLLACHDNLSSTTSPMPANPHPASPGPPAAPPPPQPWRGRHR